MTTDIISPFTWSSAYTHTQQPTPIKPQSIPTSSESFVTSNSGATTSATASTKRQTLHSTAESIATTDMTTDIISPFTWSSASTHTQQPTPVKPVRKATQHIFPAFHLPTCKSQIMFLLRQALKISSTLIGFIFSLYL